MPHNRIKAFYGFIERVHYKIECEKIGLMIIPKKYNSEPEEWIINDRIFTKLNPWECYSIYDTVLMQLPKPSLDALFNMALVSDDCEERLASLGIFLAQYEKQLLIKIKQQDKLTKELKRMIKEIIYFLNHSTVRDDFIELLKLCNSILKKEPAL